jgi:RimJ/RimL family protein N-acetyltransferase
MTEDDLDDVARLLGDPVVMRFYPAPKSRSAALDWIRWNRRDYARDGFGLWLLTDPGGAFLGECGLTWQEVDGVSELELGYHLLPSAHRAAASPPRRPPPAATTPAPAGSPG